MSTSQAQSRFDTPYQNAPDTELKAIGEESLAPQKTRIMGRTSYLLAWFGGCVSIGTFTMGSSVVGTLNLIQASPGYRHWLYHHWRSPDTEWSRRL